MACPLLATHDECVWTIMHRCSAADLLRLALTCKSLHACALAVAEAKLVHRWPRWRRTVAGDTSVLVQLVVSELSCMLAVGGTWKADDYWGSKQTSTSATDSVEAAFVSVAHAMSTQLPPSAQVGSMRLGVWSQPDGSVARTTSPPRTDGRVRLGVDGGGSSAPTLCTPELCIDWVGGVRSLPFPWRHGCTVSLRNLAIVAGGCIRNSQTDLCYAYAPEADRWLRAPPLTHKRSVAAAVAHLGGMWVVGGYDGHGHLSSVEHLTPALHASEQAGSQPHVAAELRGWSWRQAPSLLSARSSLGVASSCGCLFAVGGYGPVLSAQGQPGPSSALRSAEVLHQGAAAWTALPPLAEGRTDLAVVGYRGWLYAIGGCGVAGRPTGAVERLHASALCAAAHGSALEGSGAHRASSHCGSAGVAAHAQCGGGGHAMAGAAADGGAASTAYPLPAVGAVLAERPAIAWVRVPPLRVPRSGAGAVVVCGRLVVVGGKGPSNVRLSSVEIFIGSEGRWQLAQSLPQPRRSLPTCAAVGQAALAPPPNASPAPGSDTPGPLGCGLVSRALERSLRPAQPHCSARSAAQQPQLPPLPRPAPGKAPAHAVAAHVCKGGAKQPPQRQQQQQAQEDDGAQLQAPTAGRKQPRTGGRKRQPPTQRAHSPADQPSSRAMAADAVLALAAGDGARPSARRRSAAAAPAAAAVARAYSSVGPLSSSDGPRGDSVAGMRGEEEEASGGTPHSQLQAHTAAGGGTATVTAAAAAQLGNAGPSAAAQLAIGCDSTGGAAEAAAHTCESRHSHLHLPRDAFGLVALRPAKVGWLDTTTATKEAARTRSEEPHSSANRLHFTDDWCSEDGDDEHLFDNSDFEQQFLGDHDVDRLLVHDE